MTAEGETVTSALDRLVSAHRSRRTLALLFDYDGTLVPIVEHPRLAVLAPESRRLLERLAREPRVVVGILSGRSLDDLQEMVGIPDLFYAGTSGLEMSLRGSKIMHPEAKQVRELVARVADELDKVAALYPGSWLERKPLGLTLHYRQVVADRIQDLRAHSYNALESHGSDVRIVDGPMAVEIAAELGWSKGSAVRLISKQLGGDVFPLYAGDHANDTDALAATVAMGGIALAIGPHAPSSAEYLPMGRAALTPFLSRFLALATRERSHC